MIVATTLALLLWSQPELPAQAVTLDLPPAPSARIARQIGEALGVKATVSGDLKNDVWGVAVQNKPFSEIARMFRERLRVSIRWSGDDLLFFRSSEDKAAELAEQRAARTKLGQELVKGLRPEAPWSKEASRLVVDLGIQLERVTPTQNRSDLWGHLESASPYQRVAARIVRKLGPETIGNALYQPIVLSTRPTPLQVAIPDGEAILRQFVDEVMEVAQSIDNAGAREVWSLTKAFVDGEPPSRRNPPYTLMLVLDTPSAEVRLFDGDGNGVVHDHVYFVDSWPEDGNLPAAVRNLEARFDPTEALKLYGQWNGEDETPEVRDLMQRTAELDPLAGLPWQVLRQTARAIGRNLIVSLPDDAFFGAHYELATHAIPKPGQEPALLRELTGSLLPTVQLTDADGWLSSRPIDLEHARRTRLDRVASDRFTRRIVATGVPDLLDAAAYLARLDDRSLRMGDAWAPAGLATSAIRESTWRYENDEPSLKMLGLFDPAMRQRLMAGWNTTFGALSAAQQAMIRDLVSTGHSLIGRGGGWPSAGSMDDPDGAQGIGDRWQGQPTVAFANGIPASLPVEVRLHISDGVIGNKTSNLGGSMWRWPWDDEQEDADMARKIASVLAPNTWVADQPGEPPRLLKSDRFAFVKEVRFEMRLGRPRGLPYRFDASGHAFPNGIKWLTLADLPKEMRARVEAHIKEYGDGSPPDFPPDGMPPGEGEPP